MYEIKPIRYSIKEMVRKEGAKYSNRTEFSKNSYAMYSIGKNNNWIDEVCPHFTQNNNSIIWSLEELKEEAKKYTTRTEFCKNSSNAYNTARKNGWLDEVCKNIKILRNRKVITIWTLEELKEEAKKYTTRTEFAKHSANAYNTARSKGWLDEVCVNMPTRKLVTIWTLEKIKEEAKKYTTRTEFSKNSATAYQYARSKGWLDEVCVN